MASNTIQILITAKDQASKTIKQVADETADATGKQSRLGSAVASTGKAALRIGAAGMGALAAGATAASKAAFDQVRAVEDGSFALRAYEKDAGKVNQILGELVAYARSDMGVLFQRQDLFKAASNLRGFGEEADKVTGRVKTLSKGVALGMTNFDELSQIVGRAASAGKLTAEQYDQLAYRGIILDSSLRGAAVGADELYQALDKALPDDILKGRADTIEGRLIRLQSSFRDVGIEILGVDRETSRFVEGGLGDTLLKGVEKATEALKKVPEHIKNVKGAFELLKTGDFKKGMFSDAIQEDSKLVDIILKVRDTAIAVFDYLRPKLAALGDVIKTDVIPVWQRMYDEVIKPLLPILGGALIVAIGLVVDAFNLFLQVGTKISEAWLVTIDLFTKVIPGALAVVWQAVANFATELWNSLTSAWQAVGDFIGSIPQRFADMWTQVVNGVAAGIGAIGAWFQQLPGMIAFALGFVVGWLIKFVTVDVPAFISGVISWFQQLPGRVGAAVSEMATAVGAWFSHTKDSATQKASEIVSSVISWFQQLPGRVMEVVKGMWSAVVGALNAFKDRLVEWAQRAVSGVVDAFLGLPGKISDAVGGAISGARDKVSGFLGEVGSKFSEGLKIGGRASGTNYAAGGLTLVGERGPELVNLPRGSQVTQAYRTAQAGSGAAPSQVIVNITGPVSFNDRSDIDYFAERISKTQRLAKAGMA